MSQAYLAFATGYTPKHINAVLQGHARPSAVFALRVERETGIDACTLLRLRVDQDLARARRDGY